MLLYVLLGVAAIVLALLYGHRRWRAGTAVLRDRLEAARRVAPPGIYDVRELAGLPEPVQRYLRDVLGVGQRIVAAVDVEQTGSINLSETGARWRSFTARQRVVTRRPGFLWDARISILPGLAVRVRDAYVTGEGRLQVAVGGLVGVTDEGGTGDWARDDLMRFLAEAVWYPTAFLPSQGVRWEAVGPQSARATLHDGDVGLTLLFHFSADGLIDSVRAEARGRLHGATIVSLPWEGRFSNYAVRDGMRVPLAGEVAWVYPTGPRTYWRGEVSRLDYEFAK